MRVSSRFSFFRLLLCALLPRCLCPSAPFSLFPYLYPMQTILVTGGTGLIGTALTAMLTRQGYKVIILTRKPSEAAGNVSYAAWNIEKQSIDKHAIEQADHIIHLAGANVAEKRWTTKRKKEILQSRTRSAALLVQSLREIPNKVQSLISASAIGWYGPDPSIPNPHPFTEDYDASSDFLGSTCRAWEDSSKPIAVMGKRLVFIRTGIVLSMEGGALKEFADPLKFGMATILGSGRQIISWIHIEDLCRIYLEAIRDDFRGTYNAVAPAPVSNKELVLELARRKRGKAFLPVHVPEFALKLALGEMSIEVLKSATISGSKIRTTGFQFLFPSVKSAIDDLVK
jgi:uncharacterized protein (TIGR01777 family)